MFKYLNIVLDCVFPPLCYSCFSHLEKDEKELSVCKTCAASIKIYTSLFCPICKSRIPVLEARLPKHPRCHPEADYLLAASSDFNIPVVRELIHTFKYRRIEKAIRPITELLIKPYLQKISGSRT
ncbi:MAG: hypothetical protein AAB634_03015, partial [Patescibacteria group bacterium]